MSIKPPRDNPPKTLKEEWEDLRPHLTLRNAFMTALVLGMLYQCSQDKSEDSVFQKIINATDAAKDDQRDFIRDKFEDVYDWFIDLTR